MKSFLQLNALPIVLALQVSSATSSWGDDVGDTNRPAAADLAQKLSNPVANLISVPIQNNWDFGIGPAHAMRYVANIQPVIPFSLNQDWNLITRTILPVIHAESPIEGGRDTTGLGDIVQSFFISPKEPVGGWILGGGPVFLYPSGTDRSLSASKWGAGPTWVALQQTKGWTYGVLANHLWSFADAGHASISVDGDASDGSDAEVNATFLQPFLSYTTKTFTTWGLNTESTYDWTHHQWTVPVNLTVSQLLKIGKLPIQLTLGGKYYAEKPTGGPDWGVRFSVTLLFPK